MEGEKGEEEEEIRRARVVIVSFQSYYHITCWGDECNSGGDEGCFCGEKIMTFVAMVSHCIGHDSWWW